MAGLLRGPSLAADSHNPRHAALAVGRGTILASDGSPLAVSHGAKRSYPQGALLAQAVGYASSRYGTSGLEDAFDKELTAHTDAVDPLSQLRQILAGAKGPPRGADIVTTLDLGVQRTLVANLARYPRAAGVVLRTPAPAPSWPWPPFRPTIPTSSTRCGPRCSRTPPRRCWTARPAASTRPARPSRS